MTRRMLSARSVASGLHRMGATLACVGLLTAACRTGEPAAPVATAAAPAPGAPGGAVAPAAPSPAAAPAAAQPASPAAPSPAVLAQTVDAAVGDVDKILQEIYGMIAGAPIDIIENQVENGLFRITFNVRGAKTAPTTVFVTRDGRTLFQEPVDLPRRLMQMRTDKVFAECARLAGLHIYGLPTDDGTRQQLAEVGSFAGNVFIDCSVAEQNCAGLGIKSYPTVEFRGKTETGAKPRAFLETLTGCK